MQEGEVVQQSDNDRVLGNERDTSGNTRDNEIDASVTATSANEAAMSSTLSDTITQVIAASAASQGTSGTTAGVNMTLTTSMAGGGGGAVSSASETAAGTVDGGGGGGGDCGQIDKGEDSDVGEDDGDDEVNCLFTINLETILHILEFSFRLRKIMRVLMAPAVILLYKLLWELMSYSRVNLL